MESPNSSNIDHIIPNKIRLIIVGISLFSLFIALLVIGILPRIQAHKELITDSAPNVTKVFTVKPNFNHKVPSLDLPGEIHPILVTSIYSRISGTLKSRFVDIGSKVRTGQLLGIVDVPDLDHELEQAKDSLAQAKQNMNQNKFNYKFASKSFQRWKSTGQGGALSQQDIDQHQNQFDTSRTSYLSSVAAVRNAEANVKRILAMQSYKKITAPFSGIISQKNVDPGANIVAGGSSTSTNLFTIQQIDKLRVYVNVPQSFVPYIKPGISAQITVQEYPDLAFNAKVQSISSMLDPASRTMIAQIILENSDHKLYPGLYVNVSFDIKKRVPTMTIPDKAIISRTKGLEIVVVKSNHRIHYQSFKPGRNYGTEIEVKSGLKGNEILVQNPTDSLKEGQLVDINKNKY